MTSSLCRARAAGSRFTGFSMLLIVSACASIIEAPSLDRSESLWELTGHLAPEQLATNAKVHAGLPPDPCDAENQHDALARAYVELPLDEALEALRWLERSGSRDAQAAAGRGFVHLAQQAVANGRPALAAELAHHVYLSGVPHRLRLEALRVWAWSAPPEATLRTFELIRRGRQDAHFLAFLDEFRAARARVQTVPGRN